MREPADVTRIRRFMRALGDHARRETKVYFTGGATAVLHGWRSSTVDIDVKIVPERDDVYRAIPILKERLHVNVELAAPSDFIPVRADWESRSPFITREGRVSFHHFDLYAQALAKIERGHAQDQEDVRALFRDGLVRPQQLVEYFEAIAEQLYRYPAVDPARFRARVGEAVREQHPNRR
jgi:Nucleotidyltransferase of unknown function (DUF6036)